MTDRESFIHVKCSFEYRKLKSFQISAFCERIGSKLVRLQDQVSQRCSFIKGRKKNRTSSNSVRFINQLFQSFIILPRTQYLTRVLNLVTNPVHSNSLIRFHLMFIKSGIVLHFQFPKMTILYNLVVIK